MASLSSANRASDIVISKQGMLEFLISQKAAFEVCQSGGSDNDEPKRPFHFVIGNPAGDADSIISAIGLAYVDTLLPSNTSQSECNKVPIMSISSHELQSLRPETSFLFQLAGIVVAEHLVCLDHPSIQIEINNDENQVTLVDHNRMIASSKWIPVEIVDHHMDEQEHLDSVTQRNIAFENQQATVASTCTLIVERFLSPESSSIPINSKEVQFPASLSILLLGVILLDSVNMLPKAGKGTKRDAAAIRILLEQTDWSTIKDQLASKKLLSSLSDQPDPDKLFDALQSQKFNPEFWDSLSTTDALNLDYKSFTSSTGVEFGMASVLQTMEDFASKKDHQSGIQEFMKNRNIGLLAMMFGTSDPTGGLRRQIALCGNVELKKGMAQYLQNKTDLQLSSSSSIAGSESDSTEVVYFEQGNTKASRKQVAPLMLKYWG